jgi:hypothetical protein
MRPFFTDWSVFPANHATPQKVAAIFFVTISVEGTLYS